MTSTNSKNSGIKMRATGECGESWGRPASNNGPIKAEEEEEEEEKEEEKRRKRRRKRRKRRRKKKKKKKKEKKKKKKKRKCCKTCKHEIVATTCDIFDKKIY